MKKISQEDFILKLNNFYPHLDYSKVNYINSNIPILITCKEHGDFKIIPYTLFKNNLPICNKCKKETIKIRVTDTKSFIEKATIIHNNKYKYDNSIYNGNKNEIDIECKEHGIFHLTADEHISQNRGCPLCAKNSIKLTKQGIIEKAKLIHKSKYNYSDFMYLNSLQIIEIICPEHGKFNQQIDIHLKGHGCQECAKNTNNRKQNFINKIKDKFPNNNYENINYINNYSLIEIKCEKHGMFSITPAEHIKGTNCRSCYTENKNIEYLDKFKITASEIHKDKYGYENSTYDGREKYTNIICPKHGEFEQSIGVHLQGSGCVKCHIENKKSFSSYEIEIKDFLQTLNPNIQIEQNYRKFKKEIDIFLPDYNIGFEINGDYWHSTDCVEKNYHSIKKKYFKDLNIEIYFIWEHDWINKVKQDIIKSFLTNKIQEIKTRIYARKCIIKEITPQEYKNFCNINHIQGHSPAQIKYGLEYNNELMACMSFSKLRINMGNKNPKQGEYELIRYCTKQNTNIIGGASKLLKYFETIHNPIKLISFANMDYSNGNLYNVLGFINKGVSNLTYWYYNPKTKLTINRYNLRKDNLIKKGFSNKFTETEITKFLNLKKQYNSGTIKFEKQY